MLSKTMTGKIGAVDRPPGPEPMDPRPITYTNPADIPNPLPPGATVDAVLLPPRWIDGALNPDKLDKYAKMGAFLQDKGVLPGGVDFAAMAGLLATGFALGGPVGLIAAALVAAWQFMGGSSVPAPWANSAPGVVAYCATFMPEDFSGANGWIWANAPDALSSIEKCQRAFLFYTVDKWRFVLDPEAGNYSNIPNALILGGWSGLSTYGQAPPPPTEREQYRTAAHSGRFPAWVPEAYATLGIDYEASLEARRNGRTGEGFMYIEQGAKVALDTENTEPTEGSTGTALALLGLGYALTR